jgi:F-type H+-transporting ATPase subunit alpha
VEEQVITIYTGIKGFLDRLAVAQVKDFLVGLREYVQTNKPKIYEIIRTSKAFSPEAETLLKEAIAEYTQIFTA